MQGTKLAYRATCRGPLGGNAAGAASITQMTCRSMGAELLGGNLLDCQPAALRPILAGAAVEPPNAAFRLRAAGPGRSRHASGHAGAGRDRLQRRDDSRPRRLAGPETGGCDLPRLSEGGWAGLN